MRKDTPEYIKEIAKGLRRNNTKSEEKLWQRLRGNRLGGYKFKRQYCIGRYIADFYCSEARLAIEIDGGIHNHEEQKEYDSIREKEILAREIKVIRFTDEQVENDISLVINTIFKALKTLTLGPSPTS